MSKRSSLLLAVLRSLLMGAVGVLFIATPFWVPDHNDWSWFQVALMIVPGLMICYVEARLWHVRLTRDPQVYDPGSFTEPT